MKRNYYQTFEEIAPGYFLHANFMNETYLFLDSYAHNIYEGSENVDEIKDKDSELYEELSKHDFIIPNDMDERAVVDMNKQMEQFDSTMYHIIVNPTLDCNLSCWYCYESKICGSKIKKSTVVGIKKHIAAYYETKPYKTLKLSFFGGEPFMCFDEIADLAKYASEFCEEKKLSFVLDFTTNSTLLNEERIKVFSEYNCVFQITLDGNRMQHNKVKFVKGRKADTYKLALDNIKKIEDFIPQSLVFVRVNFDKKTLNGFDEILDDIDNLDRRKTIVILKKVWQVGQENISKDLVLNAIQKLFDKGFVVDYYTQGKLCFAERLNEVVINYDGLAFKCTTITKFDKDNSYGHLDSETGNVVLNATKLAYVTKDMRTNRCAECKRYPSCYGPCNNHIMVGDAGCYLDTINLTEKEYLMFQYKNQRQRAKVMG